MVRLPARSAAAATAPATTTSRATTTAACRLRTGFIHIQRAAIHFRSVELGDGGLGIAPLRHFNKSKTPGLTAVAVGYDVNALDAAILGKRLLQVFLRGLDRKSVV